MPRKPKMVAPQRAAAPTRAPASGTTALVLRDGPKSEVALTAAGLALVEAVARDGGSQGLIASRLGVALSTLKKAMERDESIRLAYERGRFELEHEVASFLLKAMRSGNVVAAIYYSKAQLAWRENDPVPTQQTGIVITLPAAMSHEQWEAHRAQQRSLAAPIDVEVKEIPNDK